MFKRTGLGITCLALAFSAYCGTGYCRAGVINTGDGGKYDKHDIGKYDDKCKHDDCKIDFKLDDKDCKDIFNHKDDKDCKDLKDHKDGKGVCKIDWGKDHGHSSCKFDIKCSDPIDDGGCHIVPTDHCDPHGGCTASVPAPAASAMSGFGVAGIAIAGWLRSRRSAKSYC